MTAVVNLIQSSYAQANPAGNGNTLADGQTGEHSSGGGFPGLLGLASGELAPASDVEHASGESFRERMSAEQSSANRLSSGRLSRDRPSVNGLSEDHLSKVRPSGVRPSQDNPSEDSRSEDQSSKDRSSADSPVAGNLSLHFDSTGGGQKKSLNSEKQSSDPAALALPINPLLGVYPPVAVPQTVPQPISVSVPTPGSTPGSISAQVAALANQQIEAGSPARFQSEFSTNGNEAGAAKQINAEPGFAVTANLAAKSAPWVSGEANRALTAADFPSAISSGTRPDLKNSANTTQAAPQAAPGPPDQNPPVDSVSSNSNLAPLPATDAPAVYPAPNSLEINSLPSDVQTTGDAVVAASVPSAATQVAAGVAAGLSALVTDATAKVPSAASDGATKSSGHVPQAQPGSPVVATTAARQNASPALVIVSATSGATSSSTNHGFKGVVPTMTSTAQGKPDNKVSPGAEGISSSYSSSPVHHGSTLGGATANAANSVTAKPGVENTDSGGRDLNNKDMANKDLASKEPIKDPGKDFINKDLNSKDLINKDLTNKDLLSKDIHTQSASNNSPNGQLPGSVPPTVLAASGNPATNPSIDALSAPPAITPQPAASSSSGTSASSANPSSAPAPQDAATQQSAASGSVQLARIADHVGQSEMHIGMRMPAFGSVEVHTSVHQSEVGITVGSEHGDLKTFLNAEIPALRDSLNQQNLQFSHLNFMGAGSSAGNSFGGDGRGDSQGFVYKPNFTRPEFQSAVAVTTDHGGLEGELFPANQKGLSIHA
jgi:hypothetical protein